MKIVAKNGVDGFKTIEECLEYEEALDAAEREKKAKEDELQKKREERYEEIKKLYAEVVDKSKLYEKDYSVKITIPGYGYNRFFGL